jgi:hypothetical protein
MKIDLNKDEVEYLETLIKKLLSLQRWSSINRELLID